MILHGGYESGGTEPPVGILRPFIRVRLDKRSAQTSRAALGTYLIISGFK